MLCFCVVRVVVDKNAYKMSAQPYSTVIIQIVVHRYIQWVRMGASSICVVDFELVFGARTQLFDQPLTTATGRNRTAVLEIPASSQVRTTALTSL